MTDNNETRDNLEGRTGPFISCRDELLAALRKNNLGLDDVITSKMHFKGALKSSLNLGNMPEGMGKWRLPFFFENDGVNYYMSVIDPNVEVPTHTHAHGASIRFVIEGSMDFQGETYTACDWVYMPSGTEYAFTAGDRGATFILGYECCC